jgi:hypothetical protein
MLEVQMIKLLASVLAHQFSSKTNWTTVRKTRRDLQV